MRKYLIVLLMLILPILLAACFPATGPSTAAPALAPAATSAITSTVTTPATATDSPATASPVSGPPITGTVTLSGTTSVIEATTPMSLTTPAAPGTPPAVVTAAIADTAKQMNVSPDQLTLVSYAAVDWPDACLGVVKPGMMCAQVVTPGYRIVLQGPQGQFEVHTGADGSPALIVKPGTTGGFPATVPSLTPAPVAPPSTATPLAAPAASGPSGASGIQGAVTIGPITPVTRAGQANARPYQAAIDVLDQSGQVVTRFTPNAQGRYRVALAPGAYVIRPESAGRFPRAVEKIVHVLKGEFLEVDIPYDSGIR
jgi:hypothetical protein